MGKPSTFASTVSTSLNIKMNWFDILKNARLEPLLVMKFIEMMLYPCLSWMEDINKFTVKICATLLSSSWTTRLSTTILIPSTSMCSVNMMRMAITSWDTFLRRKEILTTISHALWSCLTVRGTAMESF